MNFSDCPIKSFDRFIEITFESFLPTFFFFANLVIESFAEKKK